MRRRGVQVDLWALLKGKRQKLCIGDANLGTPTNHNSQYLSELMRRFVWQKQVVL
jgi:hypothetical protein